MTPDIVIRAEGLGKKYVIGHQAERERYVALRDVLARNARGLWRKAADMARGNMVVPGDTVEEFWALKDVSFEVRRGEVLGIIGRNGAGKSTLLKILSRITEPSEGRVTIRGRVASLLEVGTGFHPELTGRENIYLNGAILGMTRSEIKRKFDEIVDFAGVEKFLDTPVKRYSSGMYVRLAFAVAAHLEPEILVVDEVLAVGDAEFQKKCLGKIGEVASGGRTVLFVSHNMGAVRSLCQTGMVLNAGHVDFIGESSFSVDAYLEQTEVGATPFVDLLNRRRRVESGCTIVSICVQSGDRQTNQFEIGEEMKFTIRVKSDEQYAKVGLSSWLFFMNREGQVMLSSFQKDSDVPHIFGTDVELSLLVAPQMKPGNYKMACGLLSRSGELLDWVEDVCALEVLPVFEDGHVFDGRLGASYIKPVVRIKETSCAAG